MQNGVTVMDYKTLDEWLESGYKAYSSNKYEDKAANIYFQARLGNIRLMTFSELSQSFKDDLLEVINTYELDDFKEYECMHFYFIRSAIILHEGLNNMYSELRLPFGDDEEKYNKRLEILKKKKKTETYLPMLSPKDNLSYFKQKYKSLLHNRLLNFSVGEKRAIEKYKNEMLDELMLIMVAGNYSKDFRGTIRLTHKAKNSHYYAMELLKDHYKSHKIEKRP